MPRASLIYLTVVTLGLCLLSADSASAQQAEFLYSFTAIETASGIALDQSGNIYVVGDRDPFHGVAVFDNSGTPLFDFGSFGSGNGQFNQANGVAVADNKSLRR